MTLLSRVWSAAICSQRAGRWAIWRIPFCSLVFRSAGWRPQVPVWGARVTDVGLRGRATLSFGRDSEPGQSVSQDQSQSISRPIHQSPLTLPFSPPPKVAKQAPKVSPPPPSPLPLAIPELGVAVLEL